MPDDVDPDGYALKGMVEQYARVRKPMIAVNPEPTNRRRQGISYSTGTSAQKREVHYYGLASLGEKVENASRLYHVNHLMEKPQKRMDIPPSPRMIVGRYILTPEILDELRKISPNKRTGKYELTDALARPVRDGTLFAYELRQDLLPIAPVRYLIERLIDSIEDRNSFQRILDVTQRVLENIVE